MPGGDKVYVTARMDWQTEADISDLAGIIEQNGPFEQSPGSSSEVGMVSSNKLGRVDAFKHYGARLNNSRWAVFALAEDGALVISCWETYFRTSNKILVYEDALSRWGDGNIAGRDLLRDHVERAQREDIAVRLVVAHSPQDDRRTAKYFHIRPDLVGRVKEFDGDRFVIAFTKPAT